MKSVDLSDGAPGDEVAEISGTAQQFFCYDENRFPASVDNKKIAAKPAALLMAMWCRKPTSTG